MTNLTYWCQKGKDKNFTTDFSLATFERYVAPDAMVLDVGCGYGRIMQILYQNHYTNLCGIDRAAPLIERGKKSFPHLDLRVQNSEKIDFADQSCDAVLLCAVLTCITEDEEQQKLLAEVWRVLKVGGILYVADFLLNNDQRNLLRYQQGQERYGTYGVFTTDDGAILRHQDSSHVKALLGDFVTLHWQPTLFRTMNNHSGNGFYYFGRK